MFINTTPPYRIYNALSIVEEERFKLIKPKIIQKLTETFHTTFEIDKDYNIHYDKNVATKQQVIRVMGEAFHQYYYPKKENENE